MITFLLWRWAPDGSGSGQPETACPTRTTHEEIAGRLQRIFAPLYSTPPAISVRACSDSVGLAILHLPVSEWRRPFCEEEGAAWAQAVDYPLNPPAQGKSPLLALGRMLETQAESVLTELAPPFSMIWNSPDDSALCLQNDGMGQAQLFEYEDARVFAVSNRIMAFRALDIAIRPDREEWAARAALSWFPLTMTGYKGIRHVAPGTQLRISRDAVKRSTTDVLATWLHPPERSADEWLETARCSLLDLLRKCEPHWDSPSAGLTGGWDSRVTVSSLRAMRATFRARVKGASDSPDVRLASELARLAGMELQVIPEAELPGDSPEECRQSIRRSLLWQAGHADTEKHKTAFARGRLLDGGSINLMGQHGELGRGSLYAEAIRSSRARGGPTGGMLIARAFPDAMFGRRPILIRRDLLNFVRDAIQTAWRGAERYGMEGFLRLDYFYLMECTRRRGGGSLSGQPGLVIAPFLNPDFIRACFARVPLDKEQHPFHRHIIARNAPEWAGVEFTRKSPSTNPAMLYYDLSTYWKTVGAPVVSEALQAGGFWTEVFDERRTRESPYAAPDDLTMMHSVEQVAAGL